MVRPSAVRHWLLFCVAFVALLSSNVGDAAESRVEPADSPARTTATGDVAALSEEETAWEFEEASFLQPTPALAGERPFQPDFAEPDATLRGFSPSSEIGRSLLSPERSDRARGPSNDLLLGSESLLRVTTDTGNLLGKSPLGLGLGIQRRTPIVTDSRIRGQTTGQQLASGSYWFPARQDLDTMLSKIDSRIVRDVIVVHGPYSALYGPGFSFYDVELLGAPRFQDGRQVHGSTSLDYQTNGQQLHGRQNLWGGSDTWGFRVGYGHRTGNDYESGDGTQIPSSYKSRDLNATLGLDLSPDSYLEFTYLRLDQTDVEFPAQLFDMDFLVTDGYELTYVLENQRSFDRLVLDSWYNRTRFEGSSQRPGKRQQIPDLDDPLALDGYFGLTDVDASSTGFRLATTWGASDSAHFTAGVDLRYLTQELNEFDISPTMGTSFEQNNYNFPIPPCSSVNPGLFAEQLLPLNERLTVKAGVRMDWVSTDAARFVDNTDLYWEGQPTDLEQFLGGDFDQQFFPWTVFLTGELQLNDVWTATGGVGHAMRPPTLTELYAVFPVLAILQQGLTFVTGDPNLAPERLWQVDVGIEGDLERFHARVRGFYAWVQDYITYETTGYTPGIGLVQFVNTDLATISGGEAYAEYDWACWLAMFGTMSYVEGRDHTRDGRGVLQPPEYDFSDEEPLPGITPLESRVGLRFHESSEQQRWAVEFSARIVDNQDRYASSLLEQATSGFTTYDLRGYWQATERFLLIAGVENLTDKQYREHLDLRTGYGVYQPGRSFYFGTELQY